MQNISSEATIFEFTSYKFDLKSGRISFNYKIVFKDKGSIIFTETIFLPKLPSLDLVPEETLNKLLEGLHLILGISYYKLYCATKVRVPYSLSRNEADFWNTVYKNGLGEFFYKNNLDPKISPKFPYKNLTLQRLPSIPQIREKCLVAIGGGKDSIVSVELLKKENFGITAFSVETNKESDLIDKIIEVAGVKKLKIKRLLDPKVFERHLYSGHIPISAIYAFFGVFACILYGYKYFIVSNEHSSNFGNLEYRDIEINHQWSKSFEFEKLFQDYVKNHISPDIFYFSLLRPLYEIRVIKMFSKLKKYFPHFSSCNSNFKYENQKKDGGLWCGRCPKCVFAFILLSAFLNRNELLKIFGRNLYQDKNLVHLFEDILGLGKMKPFDCVGTFEEARTALYLASKKYRDDLIVRHLMPRVKIKKGDIDGIFSAANKSNVPEQFRFTALDSALVLGYGKEGKITKKYLEKYYPHLKVGIADARQGRDYLKKQKNFDIAIKTPGIKKELVAIPYTTATNIFFSEVIGKNMIIGITGSKGKSTTSSLIYEILKAAGKKVELLGNIGKPMLERLLKKVNKKTIFVLELSSAQLDDIKFSPNIAVVTNLFPEHMDYHGNIKNYYEAKKNIINFQGKKDYFIYDSKNKEDVKWLKGYPGKAIAFSKNIPLKKSEIPLLGNHNKNNIRAAVSVAKLLGINDAFVKEAIKKFKNLPHRLEFIGEFNGISFYNDASSTNPESAVLAIKSIPYIDTIFLGGEDRGYHFSQLEKTIRKYKIKNVVLFPDSGKKIIKNKTGLNILYTDKMKNAVGFAYQCTKKGSVCLLSGGSPSYSLWKNFEEKGDQFKKYVKSMSR